MSKAKELNKLIKKMFEGHKTNVSRYGKCPPGYKWDSRYNRCFPVDKGKEEDLWNASQPGYGPGAVTQTIPEKGNNQRYIASQKDMMRGYWKVVDTTTGTTVQSGITTKSVAVEQANRWNQGIYSKREQKEKKTPASIAQAKSYWKSYTKSVLTDDARKSFKGGEVWATMGDFPVVYSSDRAFLLFFTVDERGNMTGWQGVPPGVTVLQARELMKKGEKG